MAKQDREQQRLDRIRAAEAAGGAEAVAILSEALADTNAAVVARAARAAQRLGLRTCGESLTAAAERFAGGPAKRDPACMAKIEIVRALRLLEIDAREVFVRMMRFRHLEGSAEGFVDVAVTLRGEAALGLAATGDARAPELLCDLLFDFPPEPAPGAMRILDDPAARIAAARGLAATGYPGASIALRCKLLARGDDPEVLGECCGAILTLAPPWAESFVGDWLGRNRDVFTTAALAIGETRGQGSVAVLRRMWSECDAGEHAPAILLGLAMTRQPEAVDFLLELLRDGGAPTREAAMQALKLYERDEAVWSRVLQQV